MSLQAWLPLNGDLSNYGIANITVTNNNATVNNSGKIGKCYSFNGSNNYLSINPIITNGSQNFSFCCWVKFNSLPGSSAYVCLLCSRSSTANTGVGIWLKGDKTFIIDIGARWTTPAQNIVAGQWYHIAVTSMASKRVLYINGIPVADSTSINTNPSTVNTNKVLIAAQMDSAAGTANGTYLNGLLNDVRIYNNCLSNFEVKEIAKGLILHYPLNGAPDSFLHTYSTVLPNEYQEVEYVEFATGGGLNLQFKFTMQTMGLSITYQATNSTSQNGMILASGSGNYFWLYYYGSSGVSVYHIDTSSTQRGQTRICPNDLQCHTITIKNKIIYGDNVQKGNFSSYTFNENTNNLYMGNGYDLGTGSSYPFSGRIFNCRFFNNSDNECIHNFVPCYRKSDNRIGVYDTITNTFCCNNNNTKLSIGKLIKSLPNTYLPLEYIQSTGTQEIRSNIAITANSILKTAVMATQEVTSERSFVGASSSFEWYFKNSQIQIWKNAAVANTTYPINAQINTKYELTMKNTAAESNVSLFGYNGSSYRFIGRMYYFITNDSNGVVTHDMRPALRISDKKPGMYDLVTDTFYINAGSGEFSYSKLMTEYDISGFHNDGILTTLTPSLSIDSTLHRYKSIYNFSENGSAIQSTDKFSTIKAFTYNCWFRTTSTITAFILMGYRTGNNTTGGLMVTNDNIGFHYYQCLDASNNVVTGDRSIGAKTKTVNDGQWHMLSATYNGSTVTTYLDGEQNGQQDVTLLSTIRQFSLNYPDTSNSGRQYYGDLSDARVYATCLSANDITELYDMGRLS